MMLVYKLPRTEAIFDRFGGVDGSAYFIGGFGMTCAHRKRHRPGPYPLRRGAATWREPRLP